MDVIDFKEAFVVTQTYKVSSENASFAMFFVCFFSVLCFAFVFVRLLLCFSFFFACLFLLLL